MGIEHLKFPPIVKVQSICHDLLEKHHIQLDMLRLDSIHPTISGNKWYKLWFNIQEAQRQQKKKLISWGGAFSNHLHALAYAGHLFSIPTIGIVRGEQVMNQTLQDCIRWGMELMFIDRATYRNKNSTAYIQAIEEKHPDAYLIPEGGHNALGIAGCKFILNETQWANYDICAVPIGTGTTFCGLVQSSGGVSNIWGFPVFKQSEYIQQEIAEACLGYSNWLIQHGFHEGGFGKTSVALMQFIQQFDTKQCVLLDRVYTAKMMKGIFECIETQIIKPGSKILAIHTGGLQGNRSVN